MPNADEAANCVKACGVQKVQCRIQSEVFQSKQCSAKSYGPRLYALI